MPAIIYLTPLLKHQQPLREFLALRVAQAYLSDFTLPTVDLASYQWLRSLDDMTEMFFGEQHGELIDRVRWQIHNVMNWLPTWLTYVATLSWNEWSTMDIDLQRLYLLLDCDHRVKHTHTHTR